MTQLTTSQARVIDPILTAVARGYGSPKAPISELLFPLVPVGQRGGRIVSFGPDAFKIYNTARAPGAATKRVQFTYAPVGFSLVDYRLEGAVPVEIAEEANAVPGIDLGQIAIRNVQNIQALEREKQSADLARNAANYGNNNKLALAGTAKWSDPASNPFTDIQAARESIRSQIGTYPNVLELGPKVATALRNHPNILGRLSVTDLKVPASLAQLAAMFEIDQVVVGQATYHDGAQFQDVWGKDALLAYTIPGSMQEMGSPNFGYTYQLTGYPNVREAYYEENENTWYYPVADARQPVLVGPSAGFLITGAAA